MPCESIRERGLRFGRLFANMLLVRLQYVPGVPVTGKPNSDAAANRGILPASSRGNCARIAGPFNSAARVPSRTS